MARAAAESAARAARPVAAPSVAEGGARGGDGPGPTLTIGGVVPAILVVLVVGALLRVLLGLVLYPQDGLWSDIKLFTQWSLTLADGGPGVFYTQVSWTDYTPGYLWVLWAHGLAAKLVAGLTGGAAPEIIGPWLKLPALVIDLLVAVVFYRAIRRWHSEAWGVTVAAVWLLLPVTWVDSALWGQVDAVGVLLGGLALIWLIDRRPELAAGMAMAAVLAKPQFGVFLPVVGLVLLRRHGRLWTVAPSELADAPEDDWRSTLRSWWARTDRDGPVRLVTSALVAFVVLLAMTVPFDLESRAPAGLAGIPVVGDLAGL
ncbi:MAG: hypothetical protein ACKOTZ_07075, partial [Chloroflexota bacterium]